MKGSGRPIAPGVGIGRARAFDSLGLFALHRKLTDLEVVKAMQSLLTTVGRSEGVARSLEGSRAQLEEPLKSFRGHFFEAVERALRREGGGLEFAVATVLSWYQEGIEIAPPGGVRGTLQGITELGCSVLGTLLERRGHGHAKGQAYVVFVASLTLAEAMNLEPGLVGLAVGDGIEHQVATAARLLGVPAILGVPNVCDLARGGDVVRLDGGAGTVETIARLSMKGD